MALFQNGDITIHYEEHGAGYPVMLFAPGGMKSAIELWQKAPFNPIRALSDHFRVIAMDQRNAGSSRAPVGSADGWQSYTSDHVALMDYLGIKSCHLMGGCIGSTYCLSLIARVPQRISAAVLQNPVGLSAENRQLFYKGFDEWASTLEPAQRSDDRALQKLKSNMFGGDFVFSVSRDEVRRMGLPLLILAGNDAFHPAEISREIATIAPNVKLVTEWKNPEVVPKTVETVKSFLSQHTPTN